MVKCGDICMSKRFQKTRIVDKYGGIYDSKTDEILDVNDVEHKLNEQQSTISALKEENERLKSLVNACEYGQKNLMEEMKYNDEALDKIREIMKELYGLVDDE